MLPFFHYRQLTWSRFYPAFGIGAKAVGMELRLTKKTLSEEWL